MRDRPQIFAGLLIFVGLFTFPLWYAQRWQNLAGRARHQAAGTG